MLYEMMRQPQGPSKQEISVDTNKFESREVNKSTSDAKSRVSSPISNSPSALPQSSQPLPQNSSSSVTPIPAVGGYLELFELNLFISLFPLPQCSIWLLRNCRNGNEVWIRLSDSEPCFTFLVVSRRANRARS